MPRGRLILDAPVERYRPPEVPIGSGDLSAEGRVEEAIRAGFAQGLARGRAEATAVLEAERARMNAQLAAEIEALRGLRAEALAASKVELLDLATAIAARVLRERIAAGDPLVVRVAEEILSDTPQTGVRTIRVSPEDHHAMLEIEPRLGEPGSVTIVPDASIAAGGLVIEAAEEVLDARIETALEAVRSALDDER